MKEIARRTKAGFDSVHIELLQRYRGILTRHRTNRCKITKPPEKQSSLPPTSLGQRNKPKDNKDTFKQTFVSYVEKNVGGCVDMNADITCIPISNPGVLVATTSVSREIQHDRNPQLDTITNHNITKGVQNEDISKFSSDKLKEKNDITFVDKSDGRTNDYSQSQREMTFDGIFDSKLNRVNGGSWSLNRHLDSKKSEEQTRSLPRLKGNEHYAARRNFEEDNQPYYSNLNQVFETEHIYQIPKSQSSTERFSVDSLRSKRNSLVLKNSAKQVCDHVHDIYANHIYQIPKSQNSTGRSNVDSLRPNRNSLVLKNGAEQVCDHVHDIYANHIYQIPKSQNSTGRSNVDSLRPNRNSLVLKNDAERVCDHVYNIYANQQQIDAQNDSAPNNDNYIEMEGNNQETSTILDVEVKDNQKHYYETTDKAQEYMQQNPLKSEMHSLSFVKFKDLDCLNSDDAYAEPETVQTLRPKRLISATVAPYVPETRKPKPPIHSTVRPFIQCTVEEVVECFQECALPRLASVCKEEHLDGEYFRDLSGEDLAQEPFCLKHFHISKVRKIMAGWRPKRL